MIDLGFALEGDPDYWYDAGCIESRRRLAALDDAAWAHLAQGWRAQGAAWQERLAYILGEQAVAREVALLIAIFIEGHEDAAGLAADALLHDVPLALVRETAVGLWAKRGRDPAPLVAAANGPALLGAIRRAGL